MLHQLYASLRIGLIVCLLILTATWDSKGTSLPVNDSTAAPYFALYEWGYGGAYPRLGAASNWLNRNNVWAEEFLGESWATIEGWTDANKNSSVLKYWSNWLQVNPGSSLLLSVPLLPKSDTSTNLAAGANGSYNSHFQVLAQKLVEYNMVDRTVVRLGWEFNGNWYVWRATTTQLAESYALFWQEVVTTMRAVPGAENLRFCWNGAATVWTPYPLETAYPGDEYVDYIGVDVYDQSWAYYPWSATASATQIAAARTNAWNAINSTLNNGMLAWRNFAQQHGKPFCIPEWGVVSFIESSTGLQRGGLDNPTFVQNMYNFIHESTNNVNFHCYFDVEAEDGGHQLSPAGGITTQFPNSATLFQSLFCLPYFTSNSDIGTVGLTGSYSGLSNALTLTAAGSGCLTTATDSFRFSGSPVTGNTLFVARITTLSSTTAQGGVMLRGSTAANAPYVGFFVSNGQCYLQSRASTGAAAVKTIGSTVSLPLYLKLVRQGNTVVGFRSSDKMNWTYIGTQTASFSSGYVGIAASSGTTSALSMVTADGIDDMTLPLTSTASISNAIVLDDATTSGVVRTGNWTVTTTTPGYYGAGYRHDGNTQKGLSSVLYRPTITSAGYYDIYISWTSAYSRATNVPITVVSATGTTSFTLSQQLGGGQWNYVGTYSLNTGTGSNVLISNTGTNFYTVADAVLFVPNPAPSEIIVDNTDPGVSLVGTWQAASSLPGFYGTNYLYDSYQLNQAATFTPTLPTTGNYEVFANWTAHTNRSTQTQMSVNYSGGSSTVVVNQQINGGTWYSLGVYPFTAGTSGNVVIRNTGANGFVVADAIRFVKR